MGAEMDLSWREVSERGVMVLVVVPLEEAAGMIVCILGSAEFGWETRRVFEGLELSLGERIVVRDSGPRMGRLDFEALEEIVGGSRGHGRAAV